MSHKTEYIWTCKIGGPAIQFQSGADAPMRQAVQAAFKQVTGNDEVFCFSGWGGELTEPERSVVENRLPSDEHEAEWNRRAALATQPGSVPAKNNDVDRLLHQVFLLCEAVEDAPEVEPKNEHERGFDKGRRFEAKQIRRAIGDWFQWTFCGRSFMGEPVLSAAPTEAKPAQQDAVDAGMYRKKPVVIEAFQMTRERRQDNKEWPEWLNRAWNMTWPEPGAVSCEDFPTSDGTDRLVIATLEGVHTVSFGDWIIKGVKGEIYPCKPDIFEATYERAAISYAALCNFMGWHPHIRHRLAIRATKGGKL